MAEHATADGRQEETDRTKGCKMHFPFHFLRNKGAEVGGGGAGGWELGPSVNKQREGTKGNKIHFLTPHSLFFQDRRRFQ